jgi:hypothetical protein
MAWSNSFSTLAKSETMKYHTPLTSGTTDLLGTRTGSPDLRTERRNDSDLSGSQAGSCGKSGILGESPFH